MNIKIKGHQYSREIDGVGVHDDGSFLIILISSNYAKKFMNFDEEITFRKDEIDDIIRDKCDEIICTNCGHEEFGIIYPK